MAKRRYAVTERKIARWTREGRGTGAGSDYRPWLTINDVSSRGLSSRPFGITANRIHHLLSNNEAGVFYQADWSAAVVDVREQYPLPRADTRAIARRMGVVHPRDHGVDVVVTTDFLLDVVGADPWLSFELPPGEGARRLAVAVKPDDVYDDLRALDKLEIERRFWVDRDVAWILVTAGQLSRARTIKLRWLMEWYWLDHMKPADMAVFLSGCRTVLAALDGADDPTAGAFLSRLDRRHGWEPGTALSMMRHLAAHRRVEMDTDVPYDDWGPLAQFRPTASAISSERRTA